MATTFESIAVCRLLHFALEELRQLRLDHLVEESDRSEAKYLYVRREYAWFGYRIACHEPFHVCSEDYFQILVPWRTVRNVLEHAQKYFARALREGGTVVADPAEVHTFIQGIEAERCRRLSSRDKCAIRHRLNHIARWTFDERQAYQVPPCV
jgi:hypothetical protein